MIQKIYKASEQSSEAVASLLKMFMALLQECQNDAEKDDFMMKIQSIEKHHCNFSIEQEKDYYQQADLLNQEEKRMKKEVRMLKSSLEASIIISLFYLFYI